MESLLPRTYPVLIGNGFLSFNNKKHTLPLFSDGGKQQQQQSGFGFRLGFGLGLRIASVRVEAKKSKPTKKQDTHSFAPKPDEATGPFPEAVLLKEKTLQLDGRYLPEFADAEEAKLFEYLNLDLESQLDVDTMRHYEVVYLVHEKYAADVCQVNQKVQDFLKEKKGKIWRMNDWGMRCLAYRIEDADNANYILMNFELGTEWINDFKDLLDKDERVIRHLVMKRKSAITEASPPPPDFNSIYDDEGSDNELYMGDDDDDFDDDDDDDFDDDDDDETYEDEDAEDDGFEDEDDDGEADGFEDEDDDGEADGEDDDAEDAGADSDEDTDLESDEEESDEDDDSDNAVEPKSSRGASVKTSRR